MQLTRFDRWLREKYVYETHIQTLRPAEQIPRGIKVVDLPEAPGRRYKHLYIANRNKPADELISLLKENGQMYTTKVLDRDKWYVPYIAPKNKSVTWWVFSTAVITFSVISTLLYLRTFADDPEFRKNFVEAFNLFKNG